MASPEATAPVTARPLLTMSGIDKSFPGVHALKAVDLELCRGEVLALLGENGAGKSTLIKVLGGAHPPDAGTIAIEGFPVRIPSPNAAAKAGISVIYQEFNLIPDLTVRENIFLGHMPTRRGLLDIDEMRREAKKHLLAVGFDIDPDAILSTLSVARQHIVAIAQALATDAQVLVLDEPSAVIPEKDMGSL